MAAKRPATTAKESEMPNQEQSRDGTPRKDKDRPSPDTGRLASGGQASARVDPELRLATVQIYNDAMAEIQEESGQRLFPMALLPWWDVKQAVNETERCAAMGLKGININSDPHTSKDEDGKLIPELSVREAKELIADGTISGGMIPKVETCLEALENGVEGVVILNGKSPHVVLVELFTEFGAGTLIVR
jgi:predicted TIM-barrel fold metal-dependent hydrolase